MVRAVVVADSVEGWPLEPTDRAGQFDVIVSLGDLHLSDVAKLSAAEVPLIGVYGNHCNRGYLTELGGTDLSGGGIAAVTDTALGRVLGVSGCIRYKSGSNDQLWTQDEYRDIIAELPAADIVITHCPPRGCNDHADSAHVGIDSLAEYVRKHRPALLLHGHTYPEAPRTAYEHTQVRYVYGWVELRLEVEKSA